MYSANVLFTAPAITTLTDERLQSYLGEPEIGAVKRLDGDPISVPSVPPYLVRPKTFRGSDAEIRIMDLGAGKDRILAITCPDILLT